MSFVLAADIGGTKIAVARVEKTGAITHRLRAPTPQSGGMAVVETLTLLLTQLPAKGALALGVDVPGLAYPDGSVWAPNIRGWERLPLASALRHRFRLPVLVESDRNAYVTGEAWQGAARNCRDVVFVAIGTGIGAGIISGGRLVRGHGELAGCLGWMAVENRFLRLYQEVGCLEARVAGPAIARAGREAGGKSFTAREVVRRARLGDPRAKQVIARAGHDLGLGLANVVSILNPEMIVIGGGVAAAGNLLLAPARQSMRQWAQPLAAKQVRICRSRLGERAGLLGAAKLTFDSLGGGA